MNKRCALFCCFYLDNYLRHCIVAFAEKYTIQCHIICRPPPSETPYVYEDHPSISCYNLDELKSFNVIFLLNPLVIFVAGWIEKRYIPLAKRFRTREIPIIMGLDNHWTNTLKQRVGASVAKHFLPTLFFSHIWIPGQPQEKFALNLGFKKNQILTGLYVADIKNFSQGYTPHKVFKNILFIGRLVPYKRPVELFQVFQSIEQVGETPWKLTFIGNGECKSFIKENDKVKIINFLQPTSLIEEIKNASVFCLPSIRENWGLVVHECCAAGKLLITSDKVGAASDYLIPNHNGFLFKSDDLNDLRETLIRLFEMEDGEILNFQRRSFEIGKRNNAEIWADKLYQICT